MTKKPLRIGINGFGRIGRIIARQIVAGTEMEISAVNDIAENVANLVYLYNYDSTFGRPQIRAELKEGTTEARINGQTVHFSCHHSTLDVPWEAYNTDIVIDATGVRPNVNDSHTLVADGRVKKVIITHSPNSDIDRYIVMGVNQEQYNPSSDNVISSSICDVNAIAHPLKRIDEVFGIENGFVTTLHPWLSYQNLVDGPLASVSNPGHFWKDFSLGRASMGTLIPKETTAVTALEKILPDVAGRLSSFSYRTPTDIVSSADLTLKLRGPASAEALRECLLGLCADTPYVEANEESLVGADYIQQSASAIIDFQWLKIEGDLAKVVLWYDNEWGYSARVIDLCAVLGQEMGQEMETAP